MQLNAMKTYCCSIAIGALMLLVGCASNRNVGTDIADVSVLHAEGSETRSIQFKEGSPTPSQDLWSSVLDPQEAKKLMNENLNTMRRASNLKFRTIGWADGKECSGKECSVLALARARLVASWLRENGAPNVQASEPQSDSLYFGVNYTPTEAQRGIARRVDIELIN